VNVSILGSLTKGTPSHSLLTTHNSQFTIANSQLPTHASRKYFVDLYT